MATTTQVSKWGNSLGLRLPKSVAREARLDEGYPFEVALPDDSKVRGVVLADHVKNLDWNARRVEFATTAPVEVLTDVRERLRVLLGL
jgi:antitoxin component of MazEF toxin-antitoxin module